MNEGSPPFRICKWMGHNLLRYFKIIPHYVLSHCTSCRVMPLKEAHCEWLVRANLSAKTLDLVTDEWTKRGGEPALPSALHCQGTVLLRSIIKHWQKTMKVRNVMTCNRWPRAAEQGLISQWHVRHHTENWKIWLNMLSLKKPWEKSIRQQWNLTEEMGDAAESWSPDVNICTLPGLERETWTTEPHHGHPRSPAGSPRPSHTAAAVLSVGDRTSTALRSTPTPPACAGQERLHRQAATLRHCLEVGSTPMLCTPTQINAMKPLLPCGVNPGRVAIPVVLLPFSLVPHLQKVNIMATGQSE